ncbi:RNA polymerase sigma factor, partial [Steroidobacter sp.]|uniref:RNA polymerase sigma factor n=1 Tax=Steroidobacter sp. TaxID=1978227 RepID=UPI001A36A977
LRQEVYVRVYEAARRARPLSARAFMFVTARNLMNDRLRRGRVVSIEAMEEFGDSTLAICEVTPERQESARAELKRVARAFRRLSPKCREVVWLRRVDGLSQKEVAQHLGVSSRTVETHLIRGMQLIADALRSTPASAEVQTHRDRNDEERGHGRQQED